MAAEVTFWTEEKLTTLIEKTITRALDEQQKNLFNIISGNFEISKQQIAELKKEINELRQSIEHTENVLEDKVARVEQNLEHIKNRVQERYDYQLDPSFIEDKLIGHEKPIKTKQLKSRWVLGKMPLGKMPPEKCPREKFSQENCPPEICSPGKIPPENGPPEKLPPPPENCLLPLKKNFCEASSCYGIF